MKKVLLLGWVLCALTNMSFAQDVTGSHTIFNAPYVNSVVSNITKSQGAEAIQTLGVYKDNLLGCLMEHEGNESACDSMTFQATPNFNYQFATSPSDGSKVWGIMATGNNSNGLGSNDVVVLQSNDSGNISCRGTGQLTSIC